MLMHARRRVEVRSEAPVKAGAFGLSVNDPLTLVNLMGAGFAYPADLVAQ